MNKQSFWDKRRAGVIAEAEEARAEEAEAAVAELSDEELLTQLDLPAPETVDDPDRIRAFLTDAVPQRIRTRALRQLWKLNPVLANLDGLVDYGEDFTDAATVIENMQTAYQVGKGMLHHIEKLAADAAEPDVPDAEHIEEEEPPLPEILVASAEPEAEHAAEPEADAAPMRRRMQFDFEDNKAGAV